MPINALILEKNIISADHILIPYKKGWEKLLAKIFTKDLSWNSKELLIGNELKYKEKREYWKDGKHYVLFGIGSETIYKKISNAARAAVNNCIPGGTSNKILMILPSGLIGEELSAMVNGSSLGTMDIDYYKKDKKSIKKSVSFYSDAKAQKIEESMQSGWHAALVQEEICRIVNMPANFKNPSTLADWTRERFAGSAVEVEIVKNDKLIEWGLGALVGVGQGSNSLPVLAILKYRHKQAKKAKHIGLVGKGVSFDTGGISLKDSLNMHLMKSDMGGAAAVLGTLDLVQRLKYAVNITAVIPLAENAIGPEAIRPGDILTAYDGKTIEVIDTDAEGRLILADALSFIIKNYKPDYLIDLATLTGSCIQTLGNKAAGLFTNNNSLAASLIKAGDQTGERLWQLPLWEEYEDELYSDIADIKNLATKPVAGAITAAKFLEAFTEHHPAWAHLDIAGMAMTDSEYSKQRSATAFGVILLTRWIQGLI